MEDSILATIRKKIGGYVEGDSAFDTDLIVCINTALSVLTQLGVGPAEGFRITGEEETWSDLLTNSQPGRLEMVKDFVFLRTKMIFDPPQVGSVINAYNDTINELTWRINVAVDPER